MKKNNYIKTAKEAAAKQIRELKKINSVFGKSFVDSIELILNCRGKVITAGIGKSGLIARKVSATLASIGVPSFYLNPGEANHGDLGQIDKRDVLLVFSYSGNTYEITNMLKYANRFNIKIIGVASKKDSLLIKASDVKILLPNVKEADPTKMVPTSSTTLTLLFGDCLAIALMNKIKFSKERFKVFHPGGNIGKNLLTVQDIMISGSKIPKINLSQNIHEAVKEINKKKLGLVVVVKGNNVQGIVTDGDARRSMSHFSKKVTVGKIMTKNPHSINQDLLASKALSIMNEKKITSLIVIKNQKNKSKSHKKLIGIIHIHSLLEYGIK